MPKVQIDSIELNRLQQLETAHSALLRTTQAQLNDKDQAITRLNAQVSENDGMIQRLNAQLSERDQRIAQLQADNGRIAQQFQAQIADLANRNKVLSDSVDSFTKTAPRMKVEQLVEGFRSQIATINKSVATKGATDQSPVFVEQMEVDLKGGLDVSDGLQFTPLRSDQLAAESASTLRFTLRPGSTIKLIDD